MPHQTWHPCSPEKNHMIFQIPPSLNRSEILYQAIITKKLINFKWIGILQFHVHIFSKYILCGFTHLTGSDVHGCDESFVAVYYKIFFHIINVKSHSYKTCMGYPSEIQYSELHYSNDVLYLPMLHHLYDITSSSALAHFTCQS
jgi:hypothetical protein